MSKASKLIRICESAPDMADTYNKIRDFSVLALKGYGRSIGLDLSSFNNSELMINEIMGYLYEDEDWMRILMDRGVIK